MIDTTEVGRIAAEMMERIAEDYGQGAEVGTVAIVVEVNAPAVDGRPGWTSVEYRCTDERSWVQLGFFDAARSAVLHTRQHADDDGDAT